MERLHLPNVTKNLKKHFPLLLSTVAALCLFLSPSPVALLKITVIFVAAVMTASLNLEKPPVISKRPVRLAAAGNAMLLAYMGYDSFTTTWLPSGKAAALANALHVTTPTLLMMVGLAACIVGFYAMYTLPCCFLIWGAQLLKKCLQEQRKAQLLKKRFPEQRKAQLLANLKRNWYIPLSALAFFCLNATTTPGYFAGVLIAFIASIVISSQIPSRYAANEKTQKWMQVVAILTALGICWGVKDALNSQLLGTTPPILLEHPGIVCVLGVLSIAFVYFCLLLFWRKMTKFFSEIRILDGITKAEWVVYGILITASLMFMVITFAQTKAFRGTNYSYDLIYTSDSPLLFGNSYLVLTHEENDIRQPLFAVFAAPFVGIPYLLGKLFGGSMSVQAILMNMVLVVMLFAANFTVTRMMRLNARKRICFLILTSCTYTYLLFILMMDQYIVAYFWLVLCMYLISQKQQPDRIVMWGAGGTLLTSMILLPFMSAKNPIRNFKAWFADMVRYGLEFVGVMLVFCRFDVIYNFVSQISMLNQYTGKTLTFSDKLYQYTAFLSNCFAAPDAGVSMNIADQISWQLRPVTRIGFMGVIILLLVIVSAIVNREKRSSLLAAGWVAFSAVLLLGMGWGTSENGLILYALYFGWAFLVLLFQLVEKIAETLNMQFLVPVFSIGCAATLAVINIPAIMEMVRFAITNYPT